MLATLATLSIIIASTSAYEVTKSSACIEQRGNFSCGPDETECAFGCCPLPNANCCWYGTQCCPAGYTCIIGFCVRSESRDDDPSSENQDTTSNKVVSSCPEGATSCGKGLCCPLEHAVCCSDGSHCCPRGYTCNIFGGRCIKNSLSGLSNGSKNISNLPRSKDIIKHPFKICPGGDKRCPSYSKCCNDDMGNWSCCPKNQEFRATSLSSITEQRGNFSCGPDETECAFGCCPLPNANCCWYGTQCCPAGYTCTIGFCVRSESRDDDPSSGNQDTTSKSIVSSCPVGGYECRKYCCNEFESCCLNIIFGLKCCSLSKTCTLFGCFRIRSSQYLNGSN